MDVGFVKKKITETNVVKSTGIVLIKVSQKKATKDFHDMPFDASCRSEKSFSDANEFHN